MIRSAVMGLGLLSVLALTTPSVLATTAEPQLSPATAPPTTASTTSLPFQSQTDYAAAAHEVMRHIEAEFYLQDQGLYAHSLTARHAEHIWGSGVMFSALLGAARHDPQTYRPHVTRFFTVMERYWDARAAIPGYEPLPTKGGGNDKYYDDNAWLVLSFLEAFEMTRDRRYTQRAQQTVDFVLSGWDEQAGGGIWWHERHKDGTKNTCANAPAAVACMRMARYQSPRQARESVAMARRIVDWTNATFRAENGLYGDRIDVATGKVNRDRLTYNTALMIRAFLELHRATGEAGWLDEARRSAAASKWFRDNRTGVLRDPPKWSHLMIEADLELFRATGEDYLLRRAILNADHLLATWRKRPPATLIDNAAIARALWLLADMQSPAGRAFWSEMDRLPTTEPSP